MYMFWYFCYITWCLSWWMGCPYLVINLICCVKTLSLDGFLITVTISFYQVNFRIYCIMLSTEFDEDTDKDCLSFPKDLKYWLEESLCPCFEFEKWLGFFVCLFVLVSFHAFFHIGVMTLCPRWTDIISLPLISSCLVAACSRLTTWVCLGV